MPKPMREIHRILFIRTDRIGDCLMNLPAIHVLRQTFPKAWITCLWDVSVIELFKEHPDIDECFSVSAGNFKKSFFTRWQILQKIRKTRFDLVIISNPDKHWHCLSFLTGIPERIGYGRKWGFLLTKKIADDKQSGELHEIEKNLKLVALVSKQSWDGKLVLPVTDYDKEAIEGFLRQDCPGEHDILAVHAGTSDSEKRWPLERFAELCDRLQADGWLVILIGGNEEKPFSNELVAQTRIPPMDWTGQLTLKQLAALFRHPRVKALISSDSGPVHIAWISGTPVVAMYAKNKKGSSPDRWGPRDARSQTIYKPMNEITADEVYERVRKIV